MKSQWTVAALLSAGLLVGCGGSGTETAQNVEQNQDQAPAGGPVAADQVNPAAAEAPAPSSSARVDNSERATDRSVISGARPTTGSLRPAPVPPTSARENNHGGVTPDVRPSSSNSIAEAPRPQFREITIPAGTELPLEMTTALSSETAQVETPVHARLRQAIVVDGQTAIPAGASFSGEVAEVQRAGRVQGRSRLVFRFNEMEANGATERLRTNPIVLQGEATKGEDATKVGIGAGVGAAIGGILGGGSGAAKGAAIGGAAGAGTVLATRGRDVEVANGADVTAVLATPLNVAVAIR
jgi:hypothetical protein